MTWNTLTNLASEQLVVETHMDQLRENIEHLGAMKFGETALSALATGTKATRASLGTFTGNGAATQAITGVGFQPKFLIVYGQVSDGYGDMFFKSSSDGTKTKYQSYFYEDDIIISLNSDGFTMGDATSNTGRGGLNISNKNSQTYSYIAIG